VTREQRKTVAQARNVFWHWRWRSAMRGRWMVGRCALCGRYVDIGCWARHVEGHFGRRLSARQANVILALAVANVKAFQIFCQVTGKMLAEPDLNSTNPYSHRRRQRP
jgi:hypothetical protein